jgi:hypothetical protein
LIFVSARNLSASRSSARSKCPFSAEMIALPLETRRQLKMAVSVTWIYFDGLLP